MSKLSNLIYGEEGLIRIAQEDGLNEVSEETKDAVIECARATNIKIKNGEADIKEMCEYVSLNYNLQPFIATDEEIGDFLDRVNLSLLCGLEY